MQQGAGSVKLGASRFAIRKLWKRRTRWKKSPRGVSAARDRRALDESRAVLRDIATWASSVQVERLPFNALAAFFAARRIATVAQQRWNELETDESADYDYWRGVFDELREEADDALAKLFDERTALDDSSRGRLPAKHATRTQMS